MQSIWHPAPSALQGVLVGVWCVRTADDADLSARVLPDGTSCAVFRRDGTMLRTADDGGRPWAAAAFSGPRTGPFDFTLERGGGMFIAQLAPQGAMPALGIPVVSLVDRVEPLDAIVGPSCAEVDDAVGAGADDVACVRAIERWILGRARSAGEPCAVMDAAVDRVVARRGGVRIDVLAEEVNLSRRHLGRLMRERIGVAPKLFARLTRFHHAVQLVRSEPVKELARVALAAGYTDQAHMGRDFADLGGIRPSDLRGPSAAVIW